MLKIYMLSLAMLLLCAFGNAAEPVVTTVPAEIGQDTGNVEIYFHADRGNKGLANQPASAEIYAHTGVCVIDAAGGSASWKYAPNWGDNNAKFKLSYVSPNLWKLTIGNPRTYYGVKQSEKITRLCFVFRSKDSKLEGKGENNTDIFVNVSGWAQASKPSSLSEPPAPGATRNADGSVTFCLAAPLKQSSMVLGSWNGFMPDDNQVMDYIDVVENGNSYRYFTVTLPAGKIAANSVATYYYVVDGISIGDPYARLVLDPDNDKYIPASVYPGLPAYPQVVAGVPVAVFKDDLNAYEWKTSDFKAPAKTDLVIYELLLRDFTGTEGQAKGNGTVRGAIEKIPYLKGLGVNVVELMPICEFSGNNSWGYNPNFYFAIDKAYGTPQDYKEFIDKCHAEGIAVTLDMVFNQADGRHPWYQLYMPGENPFFNVNAPHAYSVLNDWNQDYPLVERQWKDALQYWLSEFRFDGFRFDLVKGLGNNDSYANNGDAATNDYNASRVARMKRLHGYMKEINPDAYFINENLALAKEENEMAADGELNWANVNNEGRDFAAGNQTNSSLNRMWAKLNGRTEGSTVAYLESHDEERLALAAKNTAIPTLKGNKEARFRRLGSAAAQMILAPGAHMIWQFSEMGNEQSTKNPNGGNNTDPKIVNWNLLNDPVNAALTQSYRELISLRLENPELFDPSTADFKMNCSEWTARTIFTQTADKELYLAVNPAYASGSATITLPLRQADNAAYHIVSMNPGSAPALDAAAKNVKVEPNCYVVIASKNVSETEDIEGSARGMSAAGGKGMLTVAGATAPVSVFDLSGRRMAAEERDSFTVALPAGLYIVNCGTEAVKVLVK